MRYDGGMGKSTDYLWDRRAKGSPHFWFSRAVPKRLWEAEGRKVVQFSLGTADKAEARELADIEAKRLNRRWGIGVRPRGGSSARAAPADLARRVPTDVDLEEAAVAMHDILIDEEARRRQLFRGWDREIWDVRVGMLADEVARQGQQTATGDTASVAELADEIVDALEFDIPRDSPQYGKLCELLNITRLSALKASHKHASGDVEAAPDSPLVRRVRERDASKAKPGESIVELFERWAAEALAKGEKRPDTVNEDRKVIKQFAAFVGEDRAVGSVTAIEVCDYRDRLRELPPKWASNKELHGLSMRDAAAKARTLGLAQTAFTTVNKHLSTISPLYTWLAKQPAWAGLVNPCNGLFHNKVKGKNKRPSFNTETLNKILTSPLYTGFLADGKEHLPGNQHADDWRFWIPLIAMFTGARIGEIAQLRVGDVRQEGSEDRGGKVWFIHIRHDEAEGLTTKSGKSRPAALHHILEKIGFIAFHAKRLAEVNGDPRAPLFAGLEPNGRGQISGVPSRWWRNYLAAIGVKNGADGFGAHSFRHTLADRLRQEVELLDNEVGVVLGHSVKTTTSGYGDLSQGTVNKFKGWMDGVRFDGVKFDHLVVVGEVV